MVLFDFALVCLHLRTQEWWNQLVFAAAVVAVIIFFALRGYASSEPEFPTVTSIVGFVAMAKGA